ncbi:phenylacetate--CoA ligase family protein [Lutibacter sp.]|uniref:phenylacetate--CoA ligase family protein n=1 Tax=Lutibacter sp. TaxID=1925666 RepID=UPI001A332213|nr:phenylacetate--CoA ligase family protein [Lutibacter sp.]MBI9042226.1 phenylacetate--CoA ligase family protein [Lutibacter sp.]
MSYKLIFKIGQNFRNPSLTKNYLFLKESEHWSLEKLKAYQLLKLQELVAFSYHHSSYYKTAFDAIGLKPSDIESLEDIKKLPIVSKQELIQYATEIHTFKKGNKKFKASTSGTSGSSLTFWKDEHADSFNRASIFRGYSWYDVQPWERNLYFWGFQFSVFSKLKYGILDALQNRFRIFSYQENSLKRMIPKLKKVSFMHGYSSMIYEVAKLYNQWQLEKPTQLKMIKGTSEKVFPAYQHEIEKAFGLKMINEYGAAESGIIAFECPKGSMHINMEGVLVEAINNEILVTNLQQTSFPILRYQLGDYIALGDASEHCTCGMQHTILKEVTGRIGKVVHGIEEQYPSLYFYYIFKNLGQQQQLYLNYQVQQHTKGTLLFLIEQALTDLQLALVKKEITSYFKNDMHVEIKSKQVISANLKKQESFISTI